MRHGAPAHNPIDLHQRQIVERPGGQAQLEAQRGGIVRAVVRAVMSGQHLRRRQQWNQPHHEEDTMNSIRRIGAALAAAVVAVLLDRAQMTRKTHATTA